MISTSKPPPPERSWKIRFRNAEMEAWKIGEYFTRQNIKRNSVLPYAKFLEASIDVFTIHGAIYPIEHRILQGDEV